MSSSDSVHSPSFIHYVRRHPSASATTLTVDQQFLAALLERSRAQRDTYDERQKLVSTYKIISKTQCLLQMRSTDGLVDAKHVTNLDDSQETKDGKTIVLLFFIPKKIRQADFLARPTSIYRSVHTKC